MMIKQPFNTGAGMAFPLYSQEQNEYYERKLKHYNKWLMDNKRPFGSVYPGFPEDKKLLKILAQREKDEI